MTNAHNLQYSPYNILDIKYISDGSRLEEPTVANGIESTLPSCIEAQWQHIKTLLNDCFGYSSPAAWNSLPKDLHDSSISLLSFKSMLKTHL